ncbi:MAG: carboxypeptidase-like regulatory domain-containing protein, partial [Flavobacteriaceae bacterium]
MPKMPLDRARTLAILLCSLFTMASLLGQGVNGGKQYLTGYLSQLEERFNVKFSFLNQDLDELQIKVPPKDDLPGILNALGEQVQLEIEKLNERYYAISLRESLNLCATVLDNFERNTVSGATVRVLGESTAIITDLDGHFQLEGVNRDAKLEIRHLGYKPLFVNAIGLVDTSPCHTLLLVPNINRLNEVIVYKFLTEGLTKQADASLEINTDQFSILPGLTEPDVLQTAQALPGIKSIDETVSQINIRGGSNDQNLILWDGIKMYQSGHFFGLITAFNPYLTQTVTAITNGTSAEFGDGVSGILKIDTKDKLIPKAFGGGGFNLISGDAYAHIPIADSLAVQFSARRSTTDFFNSPTYGEFFDRAFQHSQVQS